MRVLLWKVIILLSCFTQIPAFLSGTVGQRRILVSRLFSSEPSNNNNNGEDLMDLWSMEDDDDEEEDGEEDDDEGNDMTWSVEDETNTNPSLPSDVTTSPTLQTKNHEFTRSSVESEPMEEDDDDDEDEDDDLGLWAGAADESRRLKLLRRQQRAMVEEEEVLPTVSRKMVDKPLRRQKPSEYWSDRIELLRAYHTDHGHVDVPYRHDVTTTKGEVVQLGQFLYWLRSLFDAEKLQETVPFEFVKELTEMGMKWRFLGKGRRHQLFLQRLGEWQKRDENTTIDPVLRTWMWRQRYQYARHREGLPSTLTPERIEALIDVGIIPYQRPLRVLQEKWDEDWKQNLELWTTHRDKGEIIDDAVLLWGWEQWRMYDILRGDFPYKGDLPVLLTGYRVKLLQEALFFETERPEITSLSPPDLEVTQLSVRWDDIIEAIQNHYFDLGTYQVRWDCKVMVGNETLYSICSRMNREHTWIQQSGWDNSTGAIRLLTDDRLKTLAELNFFSTNSDDVIEAEFSWWDRYHELKRGRQRDIPQTGCIIDWITIQQEKALLTETHFEALLNMGVVLNRVSTSVVEPPASRTASGSVVGRPPSLVTLNSDILPQDTARRQSDILQEVAWKLRYQEMKAFVTKEGHSFVSKTAKPKLSLWANNQRLQYKKSKLQGKKTPLTEDRMKLLIEIDFDFGVDTAELSDEEGWDAMVQALKRFQAMHGHCFVPVPLRSNPKLGDWINQQRQIDLSPQRMKELSDLGLDLKMDETEYYRRGFDVLWAERLNEMKQSQDSNTLHRSVTVNSWATEQRQLYRHRDVIGSYLLQEHIDQLDALGFKWDDEVSEPYVTYK